MAEIAANSFAVEESEISYIEQHRQNRCRIRFATIAGEVRQNVGMVYKNLMC
jgi:hypothetical protein